MVDPLFDRSRQLSSARQLFGPLREQNSCSFYSHPTSGEPSSPEIPYHWEAGQVLPIRHSQHSSGQQSESVSSLKCMLQSMQASLEKNLNGLQVRLNDLEDRIENIEKKEQCLDSTPGSSSSSDSQCEKGRKRRSPPELQVFHFIKKKISY